MFKRKHPKIKVMDSTYKTTFLIGLIFFFLIVITTITLSLNQKAMAQLNSTNILENQKANNINSLIELYSIVEKSVLFIQNFDFLGPLGQGSGFVYDDLGHIITNHHVIASGGIGVGNVDIDVTFYDGTVYSAKLIGSDPLTDIAVLFVEDVPKNKLVPLMIANSTMVKPGEQVIAFGNPGGLKGTMTEGIVSAIGRGVSSLSSLGTPVYIPDVIQTDAAINPGNSGGPLLNLKGEVIGMNTQIQPEFQNIGYAVSSNTINKVAPSIIETGKFEHPWLGVAGIDVTSEIAKILKLEKPTGFLVVEVIDGSPAAKAGLTGGSGTPSNIQREGRSVLFGGDIIIELDNKPIRNQDDILLHLQRGKKIGDQLDITVYRDGNIKQIKAILEAQPSL